jgi:hypothetical protein
MLGAIRSLGRLRPRTPVLVSCLLSAAAGALLSGGSVLSGLRADDREAGDHRADAGVKAPVAEVMHCPLAFAGGIFSRSSPSVRRSLTTIART